MLAFRVDGRPCEWEEFRRPLLAIFLAGALFVLGVGLPALSLPPNWYNTLIEMLVF
jgi:hypothetical protein